MPCSVDDVLGEFTNAYGISLSDNKVLQKCVELCNLHGDPEDIAVCWINFAQTNGYSHSDVSLEALEHFERERLIKGKKEDFKSSQVVIYDASTIDSALDDDLLIAYGGTETPRSAKAQRGLCTTDVKSARHSTGATTFPPIINSPNASTPSGKYLNRTNTGNVVSSLGEESTWNADSDYQPNEEVSTVGRICCDSVGKLNAVSVLLEGSKEVSGGNTIRLDLSQLKNYSLFPGQVVAVKGENSTGSNLVATSLVQGKILPFSEAPISVSVAAGPFTTSDNLLFQPLNDFLSTLKKNPPHVLLLTGPFIDASHSAISGGALNDSVDAVFERSSTKVIVVSSYQDICSPCIYPTPPYSTKMNVLCVSDPAFLNIDGVTLAVTSTDALFHLGKEEITFPSYGSDRLGHLSRHFLWQQIMYPLYPPSEDVCVDHERLYMHARLPFTPHFLILPSDLRGFVKDVDGSVVINPEHLSRGQSGGSYCRIEIKPILGRHGSLAGLVNVQIVKI